MTKRMIAVWFCRVLAVFGMLGGLFQLVSVGLRFWMPGTFPPTLSQPATGLVQIGLYFFISFFAPGLGTELAAEGEYGDPISSAQELGTLTWRFVGLMLLINGALYVSSSGIYYAYNTFLSLSSPVPRATSYLPFFLPGLVTGAVESFLGFALAFGPRIRQVLRG